MTKAVFPGSFDPPTNGHVNIIKRSAKIFDEIDIVVAVNPVKKYLFNSDERVALIKEIVKDFDNVKIHVWDSLIVDFAEKIGAKVILRGLRALDDFSHEFELSLMNRGLNPEIETMFIPTDSRYFVLRSSSIKEIASFKGDISKMVPENVAKALMDKFHDA